MPIAISITVSTVSVLSALTAIFFSLKNNKRTDTQDIERRVAERTETNMKLDEINRNVTDIKYDISATKKDVQSLTERMIQVEASSKQAHKRIDDFISQAHHLAE